MEFWSWQFCISLYDQLDKTSRRLQHTSNTDKCQLGDCARIVRDVLEYTESCECSDPSADVWKAELRNILLQHHFIGLMVALDLLQRRVNQDGSDMQTQHPGASGVQRTSSLVARHNGNVNGRLTIDVDDDDDDDDDYECPRVSEMRLVQFEKNSSDPLGVILKVTDEGKCLVGRIMHGGLVYKLGTLHVGDEIREINDRSVDGQTLESLQTLLKDLRGSISMKIVPSFQSQTTQCEMYVRALFDYDPATDNLISCPEAGVSFATGDILHILAKDDHRWWQARHWSAVPHNSSHQLAGLIPSPELLEWKTSCSTIERAKRRHGSKIGVNCSWFELRKKLSKDKYVTKRNAVFDKLELLTYEEVIQLPSFRRKTLVLIGAHGVGRRHIKNTLITRHPDCYAYPAPHTSRQPVDGEEREGNYIFATYDSMLADIAMHAYLEYGSYDGALYGTKLDTIREIHASGHIAVIDVEPQALKTLRTAEFAPYIVFIAAPTKLSPTVKEPSVVKLLKDSSALHTTYRHCFDLTIVNNDMEQTIDTLLQAVNTVNSTPQWLPVNWVY